MSLAKGSNKGKKKTNKATVQMKLVDDKLRIIDDVPTSAVEMAVKEKVSVLIRINLSFDHNLFSVAFQFLKKVQRQERIVDEIKMVLKPFYNKKKISKSSYKEIMRKCVPKVRGALLSSAPLLFTKSVQSFSRCVIVKMEPSIPLRYRSWCKAT